MNEQSVDVLRESEAVHRVLADFAAVTQPLTDAAAIMAASARLLAEHLGVDRCAYAEIENESVYVITGDHPVGVPTIVGRWPVSAFGTEHRRLMLANEPYVVNDVTTDPRITPADLPAYQATNIAAVICVPLHKEKRFTAAMAVHQKVPRQWTPFEIGLVTTVVGRCWEALERARVGRALRDSEARYRAIVEATPECVKVVAPDGTLLQMNSAGLAMVEADHSPVGQCVYDVIAPEFRDAFRSFNERVCRGESGTLAFDIIGLRGTRRHMETHAVPLKGGDGGFTHLAVTRDVTERTDAEQALAQSRARADYAARVAGVGFWYCDLPFDILEWDARVKEHFWLPPDAQVTIATFYDRIHPEDRDRTRLAIDRAIAARGPYDIQYRTVDPETGAVKWIRALGGAVYDSEGQPIRFDGVTLDVTEQHRIETELREADRRKDEFIALLAHELRNPLAPIRNGLQVLRLAGGQPETLTQAREMMDRQLSHMVRLIDDLLDISRISQSKMELRKSRVALSEIIASAVETAGPLIDEAQHELTVSLPRSQVYLDGDLTRLAQVFANLLTNSAKYTPKGGRIWLTAEQQDDRVAVSIRDIGIGIPAAALPTIFDMFSQVGRSIERTSGGLGIGLALVKGLVEMHGGTVTAQSAGEGLGCTFTVKLPVRLERCELSKNPGPANQTTSKPSRRILVVDDNRDGAESLGQMLKLLGNDVRTANDGAEGFEVALSFRPEVVLMDIGMPRMNGLDASRKIRSEPWGSNVTIIALTGWGQEHDRERSRAAGCDGHLVKPVDLPDLQRMLSNVRRQGPQSEKDFDGLANG